MKGILLREYVFVKKWQYLVASLFIAGISLVAYNAQHPPLMGDRAYFVYFSKMLADGLGIYAEGTFGYTPFAIMLNGFAMRLFSFKGFGFFEVTKTLGMANFMALVFYLFKTTNLTLKSEKAALVACILFCGFRYSGFFSVVNFEPKMFVALTTIAGLYYTIKDNFLLAALFFALGALSWQPAIINLLGLGLWVLPKYRNTKAISQVFIGLVLASLPVLAYLALTNQMDDFIYNTIQHRVAKGVEKRQSSLRWLLLAAPTLRSGDFFIFFTAYLGLFIGIMAKADKLAEKLPLFGTLPLLIISNAVLWLVFSILEFNSSPDILPALPTLCICAAYFFRPTLQTPGLLLGISLVLVLVLNYDLAKDDGRPGMPEQKGLAAVLESENLIGNGKYIALGPYSEGLVVMLDKKPYGNQIRFNTYNLTKLSCADVISAIKNREIENVLMDENLPSNQPCLLEIRKLLEEMKMEFKPIVSGNLKCFVTSDVSR